MEVPNTVFRHLGPLKATSDWTLGTLFAVAIIAIPAVLWLTSHFEHEAYYW